MQISKTEHDYIIALLSDRAQCMLSRPQEEEDAVSADIDALRSAFTANTDGSFEIEGGRDSYAALARLLEGGQDKSATARGLFLRARLFANPDYFVDGYRQIYDRSKKLQSIPQEALRAPQALLVWLLENKRIIERQLRGSYALSTLVQALLAGGRIKSNFQYYLRVITARDLYDRSPILQRIRDADLATPERAIKRLVELRADIIEEQRRVRDVSQKVLEGYALSTLVHALIAGGRIKDSQSYVRLAGAYDLYGRSPILRRFELTSSDAPRDVVTRLAGLKAGIMEEQGSTYTLSTLVLSLIAAGKIKIHINAYERLASARDLYDRSSTLQDIPQDVLQDDELLMRFLLARRDLIAVESLHAMGKLPQGEFIFPEANAYYSLGTLISALYAGGKIQQSDWQYLSSHAASPIEYFLNRRNIIEGEIRILGDRRGIGSSVNRALFTSLVHPMRRLNIRYVQDIVRWGRWILRNPDIAFRSIYRAEELVGIAFSNMSIVRTVARGSSGIIERLNRAKADAQTSPVRARHNAVLALMDLANHYAELQWRGAPVPAVTLARIKQIRQLAEWNSDALEGGVLGGGPKTSGGGGSGSAQMAGTSGQGGASNGGAFAAGVYGAAFFSAGMFVYGTLAGVSAIPLISSATSVFF